MTKHPLYHYLEDGVSIESLTAGHLRTIYSPLCGKHAHSLKSAITPYLAGDIKLDKHRYFSKPVSTEDLRQGLRHIYLRLSDGRIINFTHPEQNHETRVVVGQIWQQVERTFPEMGLSIEALSFIPVNDDQVELLKVTIKNVSDVSLEFTPTFAIPIFARALANKHDHEHVTSLLNRIDQQQYGVEVKPVMLFDEEGHKPNSSSYYVYGVDEKGNPPSGTFPTLRSFLGDQGSFYRPEALIHSVKPIDLDDHLRHGQEALGGLQFKSVNLKPNETVHFFLVLGVEEHGNKPSATFRKYSSAEGFNQAFVDQKQYWKKKTETIQFKTGDADYNAWLSWVTLQPVLRRIFGCSFLPDHDYGKGGKGWRDIWQDLLSLILIEPNEVRDTLLNNFNGVRIDGSNATIIGSQPGEFFADRNAITRVWMDHGVWPFLTTLLYINQTGDYDLLFESTSYFRDRQLSRTFLKDEDFRSDDGCELKTSHQTIYKGTVIEHLLIQNLVQFFNVGEHNITRLESADWNDGLDMAFQRGESVAFMSMYAGNLDALADLIADTAKEKNIDTFVMAKELMFLLDSLSPQPVDYENHQAKQKQIFEVYFSSVQPVISGETVDVKIEDLIKDLKLKAQWMFEKIQKDEKVRVEDDNDTFEWFNGYYDNQGRRVEGKEKHAVQMTLTGQVFPLMSGIADGHTAVQMIQSVEHFLKDPQLEGYRLNTDFKVDHYLDLGRAFGFAYGTKENGAFFSHMTVMYAYALYLRGFVKEGHEVLSSIYRMSIDTDKSKIYPGVPEYFDSTGKGMYHYLTGSASWFVLTQLTQVFGVRGHRGDLVIHPKLVSGQFSKEGRASVKCVFADKQIEVAFLNEHRKDYGEYTIKAILLNGHPVPVNTSSPNKVQIERHLLTQEPAEIHLEIILT